MTNSWEEAVARLVLLIREDPPLHDAVVGAINAHTETEKARADHHRALARRASSMGPTASAKRGNTEAVGRSQS